MKSSADQFANIPHNESPVYVEKRVVLQPADTRPRAKSRAAITITIFLMGLLAGWVAGIALIGGFRHSRSASDPSNVENATQPSNPPDARSVSATPQGFSIRPRNKQTQSQPQEAIGSSDEDKNKKEGDDKKLENESVDIPTREQSSKEIGQAAMERIVRDNERMKRRKQPRANKNEN